VLRSPRTSDAVFYAYAIIVTLLTRVATKGNVASPASIAAVLLLGRSEQAAAISPSAVGSVFTMLCRWCGREKPLAPTALWSSVRHCHVLEYLLAVVARNCLLFDTRLVAVVARCWLCFCWIRGGCAVQVGPGRYDL
jgi:hypothetical protein